MDFWLAGWLAGWIPIVLDPYCPLAGSLLSWIPTALILDGKIILDGKNDSVQLKLFWTEKLIWTENLGLNVLVPKQYQFDSYFGRAFIEQFFKISKISQISMKLDQMKTKFDPVETPVET